MDMLKILSSDRIHKTLKLLLYIVLIQLILRLVIPLFLSIDDQPWYKFYNEVTTIIASICTIGAFILTIDIYKESKAIGLSVEKVVKSKNFELTEYKDFMASVNRSIEILRKFLLNPEDKGQSGYRDAAYEFRETLIGVNFILKNYKTELTTGLGEDAKEDLDRISEWITTYLDNISDVILNYEENNKLFGKLCSLRALSKNFEHAK